MRYLVLLVGLALWTGCKGGVDKTLKEVVEQNYHLDPGANLHVKNVDGTIRFYGWDKSEVQVRAIKKAYSAERLRAIRIKTASSPESLAIDTIFPPAEKWSLRDRSGVVEYVVIAPWRLQKIELELINGEISIDGLRAGDAHASVVNGRLSARNCFTNLDYEAQNGAIDFYYNWWEPSAYLTKAAIPNGAIGVFLPHNSSFHLEAETRGGSIISNLVDEDERLQSHRKKLMRTLGSGGGPTFKFKAVTGNIRIHGY